MSVAFPADKRRRRRRRGIFIFQAAIVCETRVPVSSGYIKHDSAAGIYFMQIAGAHTPLPISFYPRATVRTRIFSPFCGRRFFLILSLLCTRPRNAHLPAHFSISFPHISLWPSFNVAQSNPHNESNRQTAK